MASHFVASLELAKDGQITLRQSGKYTPLYLRMKEQAG
jgi:segregation and condensation protein A